MATLDVEGKSYEIDEDGYLADWQEWNETVELNYNYQSNTIGSRKTGEKSCKLIFARLKDGAPDE